MPTKPSATSSAATRGLICTPSPSRATDGGTAMGDERLPELAKRRRVDDRSGHRVTSSAVVQTNSFGRHPQPLTNSTDDESDYRVPDHRVREHSLLAETKRFYAWGFAVALAVFVAMLIVASAAPAFAHPGNTDSSGGHTCRTNCASWGYTTGAYHYHNRTRSPYRPPTSTLSDSEPDAPVTTVAPSPASTTVVTSSSSDSELDAPVTTVAPSPASTTVVTSSSSDSELDAPVTTVAPSPASTTVVTSSSSDSELDAPVTTVAPSPASTTVVTSSSSDSELDAPVTTVAPSPASTTVVTSSSSDSELDAPVTTVAPSPASTTVVTSTTTLIQSTTSRESTSTAVWMWLVAAVVAVLFYWRKTRS